MTRIVAHGSRLCHPPGARRSRPVNNRREQIGWYFYDWANSAFPTTVVTVFLGPWLTTVTKAAADAGGFVYPLGIKVHAGSFFPYVVSLSVLGQVLLLPVLGAAPASRHGRRRRPPRSPTSARSRRWASGSSPAPAICRAPSSS